MVIIPHIHNAVCVMVEPSVKYAHIKPTNDSAGPGKMGRTEPIMPITPHNMAIIIKKISIYRYSTSRETILRGGLLPSRGKSPKD